MKYIWEIPSDLEAVFQFEGMPCGKGNSLVFSFLVAMAVIACSTDASNKLVRAGMNNNWNGD